jgi:predicted RNA binding protein YcfA (HicA-like mRNA interferase family)
MSKNEMKGSRRQLTRLGFSATRTRGGHWRFEHPDMDGPVFAPDTPSDRRGIKNFYAMMLRKMRPAAAR